MPQEYTRRRVLRMGGQLAAVGAVASAAGCSAIPNPLGGFGYKKYLHAPGTYQDDRSHYAFILAQPKAILNKEDNLEDSFVKNYESQGRYETAADVDAENVKHQLDFGGVGVRNTTAKKKDIVSELEDKGFEEEAKYNGWQLFPNTDQKSDYLGMGIALNGSKMLGLQGNPDNLESRLETAVDVRKGNEDRYVDESDGMKALINKAGTKHIVVGRTFEEVSESQPEAGRFNGQVGSGTTLQIKGKNSKLKRLFIFEDNGAASDAAVDDWIDARKEGDGIWSEADNINKNVNGKAAIAKATVPSDQLGQGGS